MGVRNYLIEGVSGTGKTSVATELQQRGYHVIHGDRELAYRGDPRTGERLDGAVQRHESPDVVANHAHHIWDVDRVRAIVSDHTHPMTFFCGGSRNAQHFILLFDEVFVLAVDQATLKQRLDARPEDEFGGRPAERDLILRLHATQEDMPAHATTIDATAPLAAAVDDILLRCRVSR